MKPKGNICLLYNKQILYLHGRHNFPRNRKGVSAIQQSEAYISLILSKLYNIYIMRHIRRIINYLKHAVEKCYITFGNNYLG